PSSYPHVYPGEPSGGYSTEWQSYFEVTDSLPNITFEVGRSYAGNIGVQREGHPNDTLFFWGFESEDGSLTSNDTSADKPWGIWLNGGPGASSMYGLLFENGPIRIAPNYSASRNEYAWSNLTDFFWIDQPVGVGYATADADGYIADEDVMGSDFMGFLSNLVKVFPNLAYRPLYINGESYAGMYIPYILKTYFGMDDPPVNIAKVSIGDGSITSEQVFELLPAVYVLETFPQIIAYDIEVFEYFKSQQELCGYNISLTYPQDGIIPSVPLILPTTRQVEWMTLQERYGRRRMSFSMELRRRWNELSDAHKHDLLWRRNQGRRLGIRDLSGLTNGTIDPWYGCLQLDMFMDYAINFTFPWSEFLFIDRPLFFYYSVPDGLCPEINYDASVFLNNEQVRTALHAPTSENWTLEFAYVFGENGTNEQSPWSMDFMTELATNASTRGVSFVLYSGNNDALISHRGTEIAIQNTTFGGIQGFTRKPSTRWVNDAGEFAGVVHQERNFTYLLFNNAGHLVPIDQPSNAYQFMREFVFGNNSLGLLTIEPDGSVHVEGGEDPTLAEDILAGGLDIYYGSSATQHSTVWPSATISAWSAYMATFTATTT
ncbi:alpha/beta-hydrolase, partial [Fistulina hepatica ATCC 64428]